MTIQMLSKTAALNSVDLDDAILHLVRLRKKHPKAFAAAGGRVGKRVAEEIKSMNAKKLSKVLDQEQYRDEARRIVLGGASREEIAKFHLKYKDLDPEVMIDVLQDYEKMNGDLAEVSAFAAHSEYLWFVARRDNELLPTGEALTEDIIAELIRARLQPSTEDHVAKAPVSAGKENR